jgi:hypothetical protein
MKYIKLFENYIGRNLSNYTFQDLLNDGYWEYLISGDSISDVPTPTDHLIYNTIGNLKEWGNMDWSYISVDYDDKLTDVERQKLFNNPEFKSLVLTKKKEKFDKIYNTFLEGKKKITVYREIELSTNSIEKLNKNKLGKHWSLSKKKKIDLGYYTTHILKTTFNINSDCINIYDTYRCLLDYLYGHEEEIRLKEGHSLNNVCVYKYIDYKGEYLLNDSTFIECIDGII